MKRRRSRDQQESQIEEQPNRQEQSSSDVPARGRDAESTEKPLNPETVIQAAREYARAIAGGDKVKFIHAFQIALGVASSQMWAKPDESAALAKSIRRDIQLLPEQFCGDPTFVENAVNLIESNRFILGGTPADEFPDCVATGAGIDDWCCSGTLIAPNAVLTAGHCVASCGGSVFVGPDVKQAGGKSYKVLKPVLHPKYKGEGLLYDLAILFLKESVKGVQPRPRATPDIIDPAKDVVVAGYGSTEPGAGGGGSGKRLKAVLTVKSSSCAGTHPNQFGCHAGLEIVAMGIDKDSCQGDSGGPAYVESGQLHYLAGVTSRHVNGDTKCGAGSIYVRVDKEEEWIAKELKNHPPREF